MHVLITCTCKYQKDRIESNQERVETLIYSLQVYGVIIRCPRIDNPRVIGPIWPKFVIFLDIMHVLVNCKMNSKLIGSITIDKNGDFSFLDAQG